MFESKHIYYLLIVLLLLNAIIAIEYLHVLYQADGIWVYPLDDTYIHLQIAKNISEYGYWGYTNNMFSSTSSSPIYTIILAICHKVFGNSSLTPLILNIIFANSLVVVVYSFLKKRIRAFILMSIFLFSPVLLPIQVFIGMEHTLHILLIVSTAIFFHKLVDNNFTDGGGKVVLVLVCSLLCLTRYESMFFICSLSLILLLNRQYKLSIWVFAAGFVPVLLFGLFSLYHSGWFFPNSLLIKGHVGLDKSLWALVESYVFRVFSCLKSLTLGTPVMMMLIIMVCDVRRGKFYIKNYSLFGVVLLTFILHAMFASIGWLFRYEAYLLSIIYLTLVLNLLRLVDNLSLDALKTFCRRGEAIFLLAPLSTIMFLGISYRAISATKSISYASKNVYDQQIQMARFLQLYYNKAGVMANDIGAISYFTDISLLDLIGLGTNEILQERLCLGDKWNIASYIASHPEANDKYPIIMIYDDWFGIKDKSDYEKLGWIKTAELCIQNNVICGGAKVSFYTSNREEVERMILSLKDFKKKLPKDVFLGIYDI